MHFKSPCIYFLILYALYLILELYLYIFKNLLTVPYGINIHKNYCNHLNEFAMLLASASSASASSKLKLYAVIQDNFFPFKI